MQTTVTKKIKRSLTCAHLEMQSMSNPIYAKLIAVASNSTNPLEIIRGMDLDESDLQSIFVLYGLEERSRSININYGDTTLTLMGIAEKFDVDPVCLLARYETHGSNVRKLLIDFNIELWSYHNRLYSKEDLEKTTMCKLEDILSDNPPKAALKVKELINRLPAMVGSSDTSSY